MTEYRVTWLRRAVSGRAIPESQTFGTEELADEFIRLLVKNNADAVAQGLIGETEPLERARKIHLQERNIGAWATTREIV